MSVGYFIHNLCKIFIPRMSNFFESNYVDVTQRRSAHVESFASLQVIGLQSVAKYHASTQRRRASNVGKFPAWQNYEVHKERNIISQGPWSGWLARVAALEDNELLGLVQTRLSRKVKSCCSFRRNASSTGLFGQGGD